MSGIFWQIFTFGVIGVFLILMAYRITVIVRSPVHLRWELAPIPHETGKKRRYGGSYLEEYEWWQKPRRKSFVGPYLYMAREIFLLKGVWENNRSLWPFSFSLHAGIYLFIITLLLYLVNALFIITGTPLPVLHAFQSIAAVLAAVAYILGSLGAIGLILKRALDANLRLFSSISTYFRLVFLGAVFISGGIARFCTSDFSSGMSVFVKGLITLDSGITVASSPAIHIIIVLLFIMYLPLTDMAHFITKYFLYHEVRWDDKLQDKEMEEKLHELINQPVNWSAAHIKSDDKKNWADTVAGESIEKEQS